MPEAQRSVAVNTYCNVSHIHTNTYVPLLTFHCCLSLMQAASLYITSHMLYTDCIWQSDQGTRTKVSKKKFCNAAAGHSFIGRSHKAEQSFIYGG